MRVRGGRLWILCACAPLLLAAGCGGLGPIASDPGNDPVPSPNGCAGAVSGSVSGRVTGGCTLVWEDAGTQSIIRSSDGMIATDSMQFTGLSFVFYTMGDPRTGTLDLGSADQAAVGLDLNAPAGGQLIASGPTPIVGAAEVDIASFEPSPGSSTAWALHGTATAHLVVPPGVTSYSGTADLTLSF